MARVRTFEHTADVGFELEAEGLDALFEAAARGLWAIMFEGAPPGGAAPCGPVRLDAPDLETLMVRWLDELVYRTQTRGEVPVRVRARVRPQQEGYALEADLACAPFEAVADRFAGEVKAATFHGLAVEERDGRWRARVILDV